MPGKKSREKTDAEIMEQNNQLRLQLMAEFGIEIGIPRIKGLDYDLNLHMKHLLRYYRKLPTAGKVSVYQLIGEPAYDHVRDMSEQQTERAYDRLIRLLGRHRIKVSSRLKMPTAEMYRFVTEELFRKKIANIKYPPVATDFVYESFRPVEALEPKIIMERLLGMIFGEHILILDFTIFSEDFIKKYELSSEPHLVIPTDEDPFMPRRRLIRGEYTRVAMDEAAGTASLSYHARFGIQTKKRGWFKEQEDDITIFLKYNPDKQFDEYGHRDRVKWEIVHMEGVAL